MEILNLDDDSISMDLDDSNATSRVCINLKSGDTSATDKLDLCAWGLPTCVLEKYKSNGITHMFEWQAECLCAGNVLRYGNLVYSAPTSAGKTMVAELLMLKCVLERKKKAIFILPFISVAREKVLYLQDAGVKVDGYYGGNNPSCSFSALDIAICTIERANNLINRMLEDESVYNIGMLVVDELHLVGDSHRGYLLELLLTKLRYITSRKTDSIKHTESTAQQDVSTERSLLSAADSSSNQTAVSSNQTAVSSNQTAVSSNQTAVSSCENGDSSQYKLQIVGMSATLPNIDLLARWLDADLYVTTCRPIPLLELVKIGSDIYDSSLTRPIRQLDTSLMSNKSLDDDHMVPLCYETVRDGCAVLVFCPTKNWCEKLADGIAREFYRLCRTEVPLLPRIDQINQGEETQAVTSKQMMIQLDHCKLTDVLEQLRRCPSGLDNMLSRMIPCGVAFHHAGLTFDERDIVEGAFRQGVLKVLVATSTLSSGVNLPARRVIIRTPMFHGDVIDTLTYKQMIGRAGRKGVDIKGESILVCKTTERRAAVKLLTSSLPPVTSCLFSRASAANKSVTSSLKRAILEIVVSKIARTVSDVELYARCTLLAAEAACSNSQSSISQSDSSSSSAESDAAGRSDAIQKCIGYLVEHEFLSFRTESTNDGVTEPVYAATQLGSAVISSGLSPDEGLAVFSELQRARRCFVLENELHIVYLVTPLFQSEQLCSIDWCEYLCLWERLPADMKRVGELMGVSDRHMARWVTHGCRGVGQEARLLSAHKRFYAALALHDLANEMSLARAVEKYRCSKGALQSLQQSASTYAGMVTVICHKLGWTSLELLLSQFQSRLLLGVSRDLVDLVRISLLNAHRARAVYNAGYQTVSALASAQPAAIENVLKNSVPFLSKRKTEDEHESDLERRLRSRCIWVEGQKGLTESEAAKMIIEEAQELFKQDLQTLGVNWSPPKLNSKSAEKKKKKKRVSRKSIPRRTSQNLSFCSRASNSSIKSNNNKNRKSSARRSSGLPQCSIKTNGNSATQNMASKHQNDRNASNLSSKDLNNRENGNSGVIKQTDGAIENDEHSVLDFALNDIDVPAEFKETEFPHLCSVNVSMSCSVLTPPIDFVEGFLGKKDPKRLSVLNTNQTHEETAVSLKHAEIKDSLICNKVNNECCEPNCNFVGQIGTKNNVENKNIICDENLEVFSKNHNENFSDFMQLHQADNMKYSISTTNNGVGSKIHNENEITVENHKLNKSECKIVDEALDNCNLFVENNALSQMGDVFENSLQLDTQAMDLIDNGAEQNLYNQDHCNEKAAVHLSNATILNNISNCNLPEVLQQNELQSLCPMVPNSTSIKNLGNLKNDKSNIKNLGFNCRRIIVDVQKSDILCPLETNLSNDTTSEEENTSLDLDELEDNHVANILKDIVCTENNTDENIYSEEMFVSDVSTVVAMPGSPLLYSDSSCSDEEIFENLPAAKCPEFNIVKEEQNTVENRISVTNNEDHCAVDAFRNDDIDNDKNEINASSLGFEYKAESVEKDLVKVNNEPDLNFNCNQTCNIEEKRDEIEDMCMNEAIVEIDNDLFDDSVMDNLGNTWINRCESTVVRNALKPVSRLDNVLNAISPVVSKRLLNDIQEEQRSFLVNVCDGVLTKQTTPSVSRMECMLNSVAKSPKDLYDDSMSFDELPNVPLGFEDTVCEGEVFKSGNKELVNVNTGELERTIKEDNDVKDLLNELLDCTFSKSDSILNNCCNLNGPLRKDSLAAVSSKNEIQMDQEIKQCDAVAKLVCEFNATKSLMTTVVIDDAKFKPVFPVFGDELGLHSQNNDIACSLTTSMALKALDDNESFTVICNKNMPAIDNNVSMNDIEDILIPVCDGNYENLKGMQGRSDTIVNLVLDNPVTVEANTDCKDSEGTEVENEAKYLSEYVPRFSPETSSFLNALCDSNHGKVGKTPSKRKRALQIGKDKVSNDKMRSTMTVKSLKLDDKNSTDNAIVDTKKILRKTGKQRVNAAVSYLKNLRKRKSLEGSFCSGSDSSGYVPPTPCSESMSNVSCRNSTKNSSRIASLRSQKLVANSKARKLSVSDQIGIKNLNDRISNEFEFSLSDLSAESGIIVTDESPVRNDEKKELDKRICESEIVNSKLEINCKLKERIDTRNARSRNSPALSFLPDLLSAGKNDAVKLLQDVDFTSEKILGPANNITTTTTSSDTIKSIAGSRKCNNKLLTTLNSGVNVNKFGKHKVNRTSFNLLPELESMGKEVSLDWSIVDVCKNKEMFNVFTNDWKSSKYFTLCVACERYTPKPMVGKQDEKQAIWTNFHSVSNTTTTRGRRKSCRTRTSNKPMIALTSDNVVAELSGFDDSVRFDDDTELGGSAEGIVVTGMAVCLNGDRVYYVDLTTSGRTSDVSVDERLQVCRQVLSSCDSVGKIAEESNNTSPIGVMLDVKSQLKVLSRCCRIHSELHWLDPKVASWMLDPDASNKSLPKMISEFCPKLTDLLKGMTLNCYLRQEGHLALKNLPHNRTVYILYVVMRGKTLLPPVMGKMAMKRVLLLYIDIDADIWRFGSAGLSVTSSRSARTRSCTEAMLVSHVMPVLVSRLSLSGLYQPFISVEMPSVVVLSCMELNGFGFSGQESERIKNILKCRIRHIEQRANQLAGRSLSLSSLADVSSVLFYELHLPPNGVPTKVLPSAKTAKTYPSRRGRKTLSTSKEILEKLKPLHPLPGLVLDWRRLTNCLQKFIKPLELCARYDSSLDMRRIHSVCDTCTATGRVTMHEPNVQNIPKEFNVSNDAEPGVMGQSFEVNAKANSAGSINIIMRDLFVPLSGFVLLAADYSQLELRIIAHLSADKKLLDILNGGGDVFKMIAAKWFNIDTEQVNATQRQQAKQVCYGMIYGIGAQALSEQLNIQADAASKYVDSFKNKYTGLRKFLRDTVEGCRRDGFIRTLCGRKRFLPAINDKTPASRAQAERQAVNSAVQGSAADLVKTAMIEIERELSLYFSSCSAQHSSCNSEQHKSTTSVNSNMLLSTSSEKSSILNRDSTSGSILAIRKCTDADSALVCDSTVNRDLGNGLTINRNLVNGLTVNQDLANDVTVNRGACLVLQLHDELIYEVSSQDLMQVAAIIKHNMENAIKLFVSLPVKLKCGPSWGNMTEMNL